MQDSKRSARTLRDAQEKIATAAADTQIEAITEDIPIEATMATMVTIVDTAALRAGIMTDLHRLVITATTLHQHHHEAAILIVRHMRMIDLPYHTAEAVDMTDILTDLTPIEEAMGPVLDRVAMGVAEAAAVDIVVTIPTL